MILSEIEEQLFSKFEERRTIIRDNHTNQVQVARARAWTFVALRLAPANFAKPTDLLPR